jgi:SAM-dependent methyltransferase
MLKIKVGLTKRKRVPLLCILGTLYLPHEALRLLWDTRWLNEIENHDDYTVLKAEGQTLKLLYQHAHFLASEWKEWKQFYTPNFPLEGKTVLDVGAGCGETAFFYFLHGAYKVIAVEPNVKAVECLKENAERNGWNVEVFAEPFSLRHLGLDYDFMKMDGEGCEEQLLTLPMIDKPCVVEVHGTDLLNKFLKKGWRKIHSWPNDIHLIRNLKGWG